MIERDVDVDHRAADLHVGPRAVPDPAAPAAVRVIEPIAETVPAESERAEAEGVPEPVRIAERAEAAVRSDTPVHEFLRRRRRLIRQRAHVGRG